MTKTDEFGKKQAEELIQARLAEMTRILSDDILPLAKKYKVEFQFLDMKYHLFPMRNAEKMAVWHRTNGTFRSIPRPPAPEGLLVSDDEWYSSSFGCSSRYWDWYTNAWPELEEE